MLRSLWLVGSVLVVAVACSTSPTETPSGAQAGANHTDVIAAVFGSKADAGSKTDAGSKADAGSKDALHVDATAADVAMKDAALVDAPAPDAQVDAGATDAEADAVSEDAAVEDATVEDALSDTAAEQDAASPDAATDDASAQDAAMAVDAAADTQGADTGGADTGGPDTATGPCAAVPTGSACDDGNNCTSIDTCTAGACMGSTPVDGDDTAPGTTLAKKSDCNNSSKTQAMVAPAGDEDWYTFQASDDTFCSLYPSVRIDQMAGDYDLCVYFTCKNGKNSSGSVGCDVGTKVSGGPGGAWGCCSAHAGLGAEKIEVLSTCSALGAGDDGGTATIQVKAHSPTSVNICGGYTLTWSAAVF